MSGKPTLEIVAPSDNSKDEVNVASGLATMEKRSRLSKGRRLKLRQLMDGGMPYQEALSKCLNKTDSTAVATEVNKKRQRSLKPMPQRKMLPKNLEA